MTRRSSADLGTALLASAARARVASTRELAIWMAPSTIAANAAPPMMRMRMMALPVDEHDPEKAGHRSAMDAGFRKGSCSADDRECRACTYSVLIVDVEIGAWCTNDDGPTSN